jgi:hypothetical protein
MYDRAPAGGALPRDEAEGRTSRDLEDAGGTGRRTQLPAVRRHDSLRRAGGRPCTLGELTVAASPEMKMVRRSSSGRRGSPVFDARAFAPRGSSGRGCMQPVRRLGLPSQAGRHAQKRARGSERVRDPARSPFGFRPAPFRRPPPEGWRKRASLLNLGILN